MSKLTNLSKVSILVPVYNGERYLHASLDSILAQMYPVLDVLVLDDASTDATPAIVASYRDARLKYYRQPQNRGIYGNMNDGIAMAAGDYIAIYHADDVYEPTIVEREVAFLEAHPEAGAVFCKDIFIDPEGRERGRLNLPPEVQGGRPLDFRVIFNALLTYKNRFLRCPSCMVRASVHRAVGLYRDQEFRNTSDLEMYLRIAQKYPIGIVEEYLFRYRWGHGNSGQRYRHLRTDSERYFLIMDLYLKQGGKDIAIPSALTAYEAHRAEDSLMRVVNHYILGQLADAQEILRQTQARRILASNKIQRGRLIVLFLTLQILVRLPRIRPVANLFYRRWHAQGTAKTANIWKVLTSTAVTLAAPDRKGLQN